MKVIAYRLDNGEIAIISPTSGWPVKFITMKDVPAGAPFLIADGDNLDLSKLDFSQPHGTGNTEFGAGTDWGVADYNDDGTVTLIHQVTGEKKNFNPGITPADLDRG
jgi:hypothetical protein